MSTINLKFPLSRSPQGAFATNDSTLLAVADDLKLLILTNHGERPVHSDYGANLRHVIFEFAGGTFSNGLLNIEGTPVEQAIKDSINSAVEKWMPFVRINDIALKASKPNEISIKIDFTVNNLKGVLNQSVAV